MMTSSEKLLYDNILKETYLDYDQELFLWGEDLIDKHLRIYPGKLKNIPDYNTFADRLINCKLVVTNPHKIRAMTCIPTRYDEPKGILYITENNFNALWPMLKISVLLGIRLAKQDGASCPINAPEDILLLDCLQRPSSYPVLQNDKIVYHAKEVSSEETRLTAARQSAIDNRKNFFFYDRIEGLVHDRQCEQIKKIHLDRFVGSDNFPEGREYCPQCCRQLFIRIGCSGITKEIPVCNRIFLQHNIKTSQIYRFVIKEGMRFRANSLGEITIKCGEDTWIIKLAGAAPELWHNNYIRTSPTERYFTQGFHDQHLNRDFTMFQLMNYIVNYSWQKHLSAESIKDEAKAAETENITPAASSTENTIPEKISSSTSIQEEGIKNLSLWKLLIAKIKKLLSF